MRIAVVGAGGVGGYYGGRLALKGHDVHFVARGAHLEAMLRDGLRVDSISGDFVVDPVQATDDPAAIGVVDVVIFGVKTWQLPEAARMARPLVGEATALLPLLNGIDATRELVEVFGDEPVLGGVCRIGAEIVGPGHIAHRAIEPSVTFGELDDRPTARVVALRQAFEAAGVHAFIAPDVKAAIWEKFMLICTWSGIGSITRVPIGHWRDSPGMRDIAEASLREIAAVAQAHGVEVPGEAIRTTLGLVDKVAPGGTASMQRDVMAGRPSELEAQNGAVVRLGAERGVPTPTHSFIYRALLPQETAARGSG